ncbi:MAG: FAD-binding oxidoreductase [Myxococcota bacterium]
MSERHLPTAIVGGGLAGVLAAEGLVRRGYGPVVLVDEGALWKASRVPRAMMHPFPTRKLRPDKPGLAKALDESLALWRRWGALAPGAVVETVMLRPLLPGTPAEADMRQTWAEHHEGLALMTQEGGLLDAATIEERYQTRLSTPEALVYRPAMSLAIPVLLDAVLQTLTETTVHATRVEQIAPAGPSAWELTLADGDRLVAGRVVLAMGMGMKGWFPRLTCHGVGGELLRQRVGQPLTALISAGGAYLAFDGPNHVVLGATHWREPAWGTRPDEAPRAQLRERAEQLWMDAQWIGEGTLWRGMRLMWMPDRMPLVGALPGYDGLFVLGGLSSKGALWGPWAAHALVELICEGRPVPHLLDVARVPTSQWHTAAHPVLRSPQAP